MLFRSLDEKMLRYLKAIKTLAFDTSRRIKPLAQMIGKTAGDTESVVDPNEIVREAVEQSQPLWKDLAVRPSDTPVVLSLNARKNLDGNRAALRAVLLNLIKNAVEAMPSGGRLTLETVDVEAGICLRIRDTGVGMDGPTQAKIFRPFFSTKGAGEGRGLGMSAVASIVADHHGTVRVAESLPGEGTTIELLFPPSRGSGAPTPELSAEADSLPLNIRWLDDETEVTKTGSELLRFLGHAVDVADDGFAALDLLSRNAYDLVLTDLGMRGLNGWEFTERARAAGVLCPIVLLTAWGQYVTEQQVKNSSLFEVLAKPVGLADLKALLLRVANSAGGGIGAGILPLPELS